MFKISPIEGERPYGRIDIVDEQLAAHDKHLKAHRRAIIVLALALLAPAAYRTGVAIGVLIGWWS